MRQMPKNGEEALLASSMIEAKHAYVVDVSVSIKYGVNWNWTASYISRTFADKRSQATHLLRIVSIVSLSRNPNAVSFSCPISMILIFCRFDMLERGMYPSMQSIKKWKKKGFDFYKYEQSVAHQLKSFWIFAGWELGSRERIQYYEPYPASTHDCV